MPDTNKKQTVGGFSRQTIIDFLPLFLAANIHFVGVQYVQEKEFLKNIFYKSYKMRYFFLSE